MKRYSGAKIRRYILLLFAIAALIIGLSLQAAALFEQGFVDMARVFGKAESGTGLYLDVETRLDSGDLVSALDTLFLHYEFEILNEQLFAIDENPDKSYIIPVPDGLTWAGDTVFPFIITMPMGHLGDLQFAQAEIIGGVAYLTFSGDFWEQPDMVEFLTNLDVDMAYFELPTRISDPLLATEPEFAVFDLLGGENLLLYIAEFQKSRHEIEKAGSYANNVFTWEITYIPGAEDTDYPIRLVDTFDNSRHVLIPGSLTIIRDEQLLTPDVAHLAGESSISYEIAAFNPAPITISYQTRLADGELEGGRLNLDTLAGNTASLLDSNELNIVDPVTETVIVKADVKNWTYKHASQSGRQINWVIEFYTLGRSLENLVLIDNLPEGLILNPLTVVVTGIGGAAPPFAVIPREDGVLEVEIEGPYSAGGYRVTYSTTIDPNHFDISSAPSFTNHAEFQFDWQRYDIDGTAQAGTPAMRPDSYTLTPNVRVVAKSGSYNSRTNEITWTVTVNPYNVDVLYGTITDDLTGYGLTYAGGFSGPGDGSITLDDVSGDNKTLTLSVGDIGTATRTFSFRTTIDDPAYFATNHDGRYRYNNAAFVGYVYMTDEEREEPEEELEDEPVLPEPNVSTSYTGSVWFTSRVIEKEGLAYNYNNHRATWRVIINHNRMRMTGVVLTDLVATGQTFVPGSVSIVENSVPLDLESLDITYGGGMLTIEIPELNDRTVITYDTLVDPDLIPAFRTDDEVTISNSAHLAQDVYPAGVTEAASIDISNIIVSKTGTFDPDNKLVSYVANINPNELTNVDAVLSDMIPPGLQLDVMSIVLMDATVDADGVFSELGVRYTYDDPAFSYTPGGFVLDLPDGPHRFILKYDCYITNINLRPYINNLALSERTGIEEEVEVEIVVPPSGGGVSSKKVKLNVIKVDSLRPGVMLGSVDDAVGVDFELYQKIGASNILIMEGTTNLEGEVSFYPLSQYGIYVLRETRGLPGYDPATISSETTDDVTVYPKDEDFPEDIVIRIDKSGGDTTLYVTDDPQLGTIEFIKRSDKVEKGVFLPLTTEDARFRITDLTPGSSYTLEATSGLDGRVTFSNVPPFGIYEVQEIETPPYHTPAAPFRVEIDSAGVTLAGFGAGGTNTVDNEYFRPDFIITKRDDAGAPLAGVSFEIFDEYDDPFDPPWVVTTDGGGAATFVDLYGGDSYIIREVGTPLAGYYETGEYAVGPVNQAANYSLSWRNFRHGASLQITKVDVMRPGVLLPGATFELYHSNELNDGPDLDSLAGTETTGVNGKATFTGLDLIQNTASLTIAAEPALLSTDYWLVETVAPTGYILDPTPLRVTLDPSGKITPRTYVYTKTLTDEPIEHGYVTLVFTKYSNKSAPYTLGNTPVEGVVFELTDQTTGSDYALEATSDEDGIVFFENIPFGTYSLHEVGKEVYHHALTDIEVIFDENGICTSFNGIPYPVQNEERDDFVVINEIYTPDLIITKTKADGVTPLSGVVLELCKANGDSFSPPRLETTDIDGMATFTDLYGGDSYLVKETGPVAGYYLSGEYSAGPIDQAGDLRFTWYNYEHAASIEMTKLDSLRGPFGVKTGVLIEGAQFELYHSNLGDTGPDLARQVGSALSSDENGRISFNGLELDQNTTTLTINTEPVLINTIYWLVEITPAEGYEPHADPVPVTLSTRTGTVGEVVEDDPVTGDIVFTKYTDRDYDIEEQTELPGATFTIVDQTAGSSFTMTATSDASGQVEFLDVPHGVYLVYEIDGDENDGSPLHHRQNPVFEVIIDTNGDLTWFNGLEVGEDVDLADLEIIDEIFRTDLTITVQNDLGAAMPGLTLDIYRIVGGFETASPIGSEVT
ncbi:MAG: hypothetical protein LBB91_04010, partial [Clostridiales bacterium]|nr:hypothetical protein [Clostridiales bacterium]